MLLDLAEDFAMDHGGEETDVPEFGAIFMSNIATKRECFRRNILALPSSKANFVKHVKEGMVLFLFEFEKRQLFGVYQATSDGGMNLSMCPFVSSGKQFPAQVCFAPIWECSPLCENEFRNAIKENYVTAKKFRFGLSEKQVHHLLHLFSSRKLPSRHFSRIVARPAGNDRRWADQSRFSVRKRLQMEHCEDDFPPMDMSEFLQNSPHRAIEADDNMPFIDDRVENGRDINITGGNLWTDRVGKRKRVYDNDADTGLYDTHASLPSYRIDNHQISSDKDRIPATCGRFPMAESSENDCNIYSRLSPGVVIKYTECPLDSTRRADHERPVSGSTNRHATDNDMFLGNDTMKSKLNSHRSFRHIISDELEEDHLERSGRANDSSVFPMSRLGQNHDMDGDVNPVVPSKNFDNLHHLVEGTSGGSKHLMDKRMDIEHNLDNGIGFDLFSEKFRNSCDSDPRRIDERRYLIGNKMMKGNCMAGVRRSTTSYESSGFDTRIQRQVGGDYLFSENSGLDNRQDGGNFRRPVSYTSFSDSLDCFRKSCLDTHFFEQKGLQNQKTSNSTYHDSVATRTISSAPECATVKRHSLSTGVDQGNTLSLDIPPYYDCGGDLRDLSNQKSFEGEGSGRLDSGYHIENKDFHHAGNDFTHPYAAQASQCLELRSSASIVDMSLLFAPSAHGSVTLRESGDLFSHRESPRASGNHAILPEGMQKYSQWGENGQKNAGNEVLPSSTNLTSLGYHREHLTNEELEYKSYQTHTSKDDGQHCLNPGNVYSNSEIQRKSVFTRLTSGSRVCIQEENEKDDTLYLDASVDEVMEMLNSYQNIRLKNLRKFRPVGRQHDRYETVRIEKQASPEQVKRVLSTQMEDETKRVNEEGVHEMPKETREVEFKRRRDLKKGLDEKSTKNYDPSKDDNTSRENAESEGQANKQQKRRRLVRPIFGSAASVDAVGNESLHSQSHSSQNKIQYLQ